MLHGEGISHAHADISVGQIRGYPAAGASACFGFTNRRAIAGMPGFNKTFQVFPTPIFTSFLENRITRFEFNGQFGTFPFRIKGRV